MTSAEYFVRLEGTPTRMRKLLRDLEGRASVIIHDKYNTVYVGVPSQELSWLDKIAKDIGIKKSEVQELPKYDMAPCGAFTTSLRQHAGRCKKCAAFRPQKPHHGEVVTVVKVEGLHDLTLKGLITLMRGKMDEALTLAQEYDTVIKAVEKIPELVSQIEVLEKQMVEHKQALKYFTK